MDKIYLITNDFEYYKHKYISMFNQAQNRINKMMEDGMSVEEVERKINLEVKNEY